MKVAEQRVSRGKAEKKYRFYRRPCKWMLGNCKMKTLVNERQIPGNYPLG